MPLTGPKQVNLYEAKSHLSQLVSEAAAGAEIIIARAGEPVARLVPLAFAGDVDEMIRANGFVELPVEVRHATALRSLNSYHRDPFDRMLIAQAKFEECTLVTADTNLAQYGVDILDSRS